MYNDLLTQISLEAKKSFDAIFATYNFENGNEFEVALCKFLRLVLPKKYSICRGYIVTADNQKAGDDLIIYNADAFPKVRIIEDDFCVKQYIPVEAVYAYIEAKHTLCIDGNEKENTFQKALKQISVVKNLPREKKIINPLENINLGTGLEAIRHPRTRGWPDHDNPIFSVIFSRNFKSIKNDMSNEYLLTCLNDMSLNLHDETDLIHATRHFFERRD